MASKKAEAAAALAAQASSEFTFILMYGPVVQFARQPGAVAVVPARRCGGGALEEVGGRVCSFLQPLLRRSCPRRSTVLILTDLLKVEFLFGCG